jgi:nucleoside-diphosphate-sugar epimerase
MKIVVCGAGGAIGGHLVRELLVRGNEVRAIDIKPKNEWWQLHNQAQNVQLDCTKVGGSGAFRGADAIYDLAENMGGIGYITTHKVACAESIEIGIAILREAVKAGVPRVFFSSSACVYNTNLQNTKYMVGGSGQSNDWQMSEDMAWPAQPEEGYGFSKLYMEELMKHYAEEQGLEVRIARYHNVFGEHSTWNDGKEKAPAAMCRKVATAVKTGNHEIEIWGTGKQLRSYLHMEDCVRGTIALMESDYSKPVNIGSDRSVTVDDLVSIVEQIGGVRLSRRYVDGAIGVDARNADISLAKEVCGWEPEVSLEYGLAMLYTWIEQQLNETSDKAFDTSDKLAEEFQGA